jgi:nitroreductase
VVVGDQEVREELVAHSWNQRQVADASHLLVIALRTDVDESYVDRFVSRVEEVRGEPGFTGYRDMMVGFIQNLDEEGIKNWGKLQTYIALGQFMTVAAMMKIDTCPMEGFVASEYDRILGFEERQLTTAVLCPAGYRSEEDKYAHLPKVRFQPEDVITHQ